VKKDDIVGGEFASRPPSVERKIEIEARSAKLPYRADDEGTELSRIPLQLDFSVGFALEISASTLYFQKNHQYVSPTRWGAGGTGLMCSREVLLGITGKDFTIVAASKAAMRGATILKATDDKTRELNKHTLMAFVGEAGDTSMPPVWCSF
jgi:hypothetical protein